jgi:hypothetical protein
MQSDACVIGWPLHNFMLHRIGVGNMLSIRNVPTSHHWTQPFHQGTKWWLRIIRMGGRRKINWSKILDVLNACVCAYCMFVLLVRLQPRWWLGVPPTFKRVSLLPHLRLGSICTPCPLLPLYAYLFAVSGGCSGLPCLCHVCSHLQWLCVPGCCLGFLVLVNINTIYAMQDRNNIAIREF